MDTRVRSTDPLRLRGPGRPPPGAAPPRHRDLDVAVSMRLTAEEVDWVFAGRKTTHTVRYAVKAPCGCVKTCTACCGEGCVRESQPLRKGTLGACRTCSGAGGVPEATCSNCSGGGVVRIFRQAVVPCSPEAFATGTRHLVRCGNSVFTGQKGDAVITFETDHLPYDIVGSDVVFAVRVSAMDPHLNIVLPAPAGNMRVNSLLSFGEIPNPSHVYCFSDWGLGNGSGGRGHALVKVNIDYSLPGKTVVAENGVLVRVQCTQPPRRV